MTAVKQMKSTENLDYYLFGIKRLTEQKYFSIMHAAKQSLKVANHELAYRQVKFLDDFYEYLLSQQKKIQYSSEKIRDMDTEIASLRRTLKENKVKSHEELKNMLKFSEEQKAKIDELNRHTSDHLEAVFESRYKEFNEQKKKEELERKKFVHKLNKIKSSIIQIKSENENLKHEFSNH